MHQKGSSPSCISCISNSTSAALQEDVGDVERAEAVLYTHTVMDLTLAE